MFKLNLNPCGISTKDAAKALAGNALEGIKSLPGIAANGMATLKARKTEKKLKTKIDILKELNEVEQSIGDMVMNGVTGDELDTAIAYADILKEKVKNL